MDCKSSFIYISGFATTATSLFGKFCITGCFFTLHTYAQELFPTVVRNTGYGFSSLCARFAAILAPFMGNEVAKLGRWVPISIFAGFCLVAAISVYWLPETKGRKIPDSIEEGESF